MNDVSMIIGVGAIFLGIFILLVSAVGLFRFPDLYLRASAVGTSAGLGVACIVVGALLIDFSWMNLIKALIAVLAQMLASAVGSMAIARSGYQNNSLPADITWIDDLRLTRRDLHDQGEIPR
ncbi:MAG: monovalent cation/H(+) antiporter subunit G [Nesterenkonia sp.]|uniref:monovalent cation/H(+) antiporter subunit G n=1 Tax=Nesterenkonia marinintestina TaxID=2979865 RepID=UPI0021C0CCCD|nr:monovalent cation/H(+) antiporter subunit G [Nesterenkonia sp. GX14115]MDO5493116.1 monovalent cation/H(+) antiporter subunit G [Nesterenkonia sp.]